MITIPLVKKWCGWCSMYQGQLSTYLCYSANDWWHMPKGPCFLEIRKTPAEGCYEVFKRVSCVIVRLRCAFHRVTICQPLIFILPEGISYLRITYG